MIPVHPREVHMEDEELGREKGDLLRYLIRVAILLSGAALVLQLLF